VAEHATVMSTLAEHVAHALTRLKRGDGHNDVRSTAELAKGYKAGADEIVRRSSRVLDQTGHGLHLRRLLGKADDVADALEEAAFMLRLVPAEVDPKTISLLDDLADLVNRGAHEYVRCLEDVRDLPHAPARAEIERFLVTLDQLVELEHQGGTAERTIRERLMHNTSDFRELYVVSTMAHGLEQAVGRLAQCGLIVRDYVLDATSGTTINS
jgi:uncharacterized protein Yka (UPF0111/DUF47 family)